MLSTFGAAAVILVFVIVYNYRKRQLLGQEILAAIEKGIEVPFPPPKKRNYLNLGLVWTLVGVAFTLALWFTGEGMEAAVWGFLPIAVGVAFLLIAYFERKAKEGEESA
jgi:hypothetical protein